MADTEQRSPPPPPQAGPVVSTNFIYRLLIFLCLFNCFIWECYDLLSYQCVSAIPLE